jgi:hypothetical protein
MKSLATPVSLALAALLLLNAATNLAQQPRLKPVASDHALTPTTNPPLIVIGFAGGFIKRTSKVHGEVELASRLREKYGSAIHADVFENHHGRDAYREILRLVADIPAPHNSARIILYGHSWGASEAVDVARRLQRDHVPVLLLVEVDGVRKHPHDDSLIPANVARAINFYQTEGLLHGRPLIHPADPGTTQIIDNVHLTYTNNDVPTPGYPWFARTFTRRHIEIENDPRVWNQVEALIQSNLPPPALANIEPSPLDESLKQPIVPNRTQVTAQQTQVTTQQAPVTTHRAQFTTQQVPVDTQQAQVDTHQAQVATASSAEGAP